ncbi:hypothetical protein F5B21DRAFT_527381 [Xylaria acuta]|nr:hypothetical protein F5B21DRAFT_527381 [Xylaria acuta]
MGVHATAGIPFSAKKMRRQAPTVKKLRQQALANKSGNAPDYTMLLKLMNEKHIPRDISAFLQQSQAEVLKNWVYGPWEDVESRMVDTIKHPVGGDDTPKRASPSSFRGERPQDKVSGNRFIESRSEAGSWQTATEEAKQHDESGAISDTSFTPPTNLAKCVRFDNEGRRHMLPPPGLGNAAPKHPSRFVCKGVNGQKHLMPPPGFRGALPKLIDEPCRKPPVALKFERKKDFKKEFEKRQVTHGGISLAVMREQPTRSKEEKNKCSFEVRQSVPEKEKPAVPKTRAGSSPTNRLIGGWESAFLKGIFDAEEDLLYSSRWPASTF